MYSRILVPLDGSTLAESILPHATAVAQRFGATLVLMRVRLSEARAVGMTTPTEAGLMPIGVSVAEQLVEADEEAARAYLHNVSESLKRSGVAFEAFIADGDPVLALTQAVREQKIDLVTMATHGRSALGRLFQGSVAEDLLHEVGVPVLMLHIKG